MMGDFQEDINVPFAWTIGSVIRVIQLIGKLKNFHSFRTFPSIETRVIAGFLQSLGSLGSLVRHLFSVSISFAYTSQTFPWIRFIWLGINFLYHLGQSITDPSFQTNSTQ